MMGAPGGLELGWRKIDREKSDHSRGAVGPAGSVGIEDQILSTSALHQPKKTYFVEYPRGPAGGGGD
jgi:hypothetical protein